MTEHLVFRAALPSDLASIIALHEADELGGHGDAWTEENRPAYERGLDALLNDPRESVLVAEQDGVVIGSMIATMLIELSGRARPHVLFRSIQIDARYRGLGIGAAMMAYAEEEVRQRGAMVAELTSSRKRTDAHRFYDRLGYVQSHLGFKKKL
jgi:GNAT superfamily N-acetyltransferase